MITFKSKSYENIMYFNEVAKSLLKFMGHSGTVPGALKAMEVPEALANLQKNLDKKPSPLGVEEEEQEAPIGLSKRAIPLINMLNAAIKKQSDVLWE